MTHNESTRCACASHAWLATALAGLEVQDLELAGATAPRIAVTLTHQGEVHLDLARLSTWAAT